MKQIESQFDAFDKRKPIAIIGMGIMGTKVAWACAKSNLLTYVFDAEANKAESSRKLALSWSHGDEREQVAEKMVVKPSLISVLDGVQLAFENLPEKISLKQRVIAEINDSLASSAYIGSNTSSLLCTPLAESSGRPDRFFNLNFTDPRVSKLVELMTCKFTAPETITFANMWSRHIGMSPIWVRKEQMGYSFNRLWRVIKKEILRQIDQGYTTPEDIDRAWMLTYGTEKGPCGIMDDIGLHTVLSVEQSYFEKSKCESDRPPGVLFEMVRQGQYGVVSGQGFYSYPNPEYQCQGFLNGV
jgi:3-hydroxybutyryl-CoA dehydrogenase